MEDSEEVNCALIDPEVGQQITIVLRWVDGKM